MMKIGIIGTGAIGGTIAKKLGQAGHEVKIYSNMEPEKLQERAAELGVLPATKEEIVKDVEVLIISVPTAAVPELKALIASTDDKVTLIDTSNYYPFRDSSIESLPGQAESVWVSEILGKPVIKAFNNLLAHSLEHGGRPRGAKDRIAMAISGDDQVAKIKVSALINDAGFDAVDAGNLKDSWRHQPGTPAYCTELNTNELREALHQGDQDAAPGLRDHVIETFMKRSSTPSHEDIIAMNRSLFPVNPKQN